MIWPTIVTLSKVHFGMFPEEASSNKARRRAGPPVPPSTFIAPTTKVTPR